MSEGTERFLHIALELLFDTETHPETKEKVYVEPNVCAGCPYGRLCKDGTYECYRNECPFMDEDEEERDD